MASGPSINEVASGAVIRERARSEDRSGKGRKASSMAQSAVAKILVGPYGLHAFAAVVLGLFLAFLWVFNFTSFF
jgi:hypothetical protein